MLSARIGHVSKAGDYEKWRGCSTEDDMFYGRLDHLVYKPESTPEWGKSKEDATAAGVDASQWRWVSHYTWELRRGR